MSGRRVAKRAPARRAPAKRAPAKRQAKKRNYPGRKPLRQLAKGLPMAGGAIGGYLGGPVGAGYGASAGKLGQALIEGMGDYTIDENIFLKGEMPAFSNISNQGGGAILIEFREYLGDLITSDVAGEFKVQSFPINPTNEQSFPWMAQCAPNFNEWNPLGIVYEFRSMSATALGSTSTALGTVIMSTEYNATLPQFGSKSEMANHQYSKSIRPSEDCYHLIECKKSSSVLGNYYCSTVLGDDKRFSVLGNFQIATQGQQAASQNLGEIWVTYSIQLAKPRLYDALGNDVQVMNVQTQSQTCSIANPLGTAWYLKANSNLSIISPTSTVLTMPYSSVDKSYNVNCYWRGDSTATINLPSRTPSGGCTDVEDMYLGDGILEDFAYGQNGVTGRYLCTNFNVKVAGGSHAGIITFGTSGVIPTNSSIDIKIHEIPNDFTYTDDNIDFLEAQ